VNRGGENQKDATLSPRLKEEKPGNKDEVRDKSCQLTKVSKRWPYRDRGTKKNVIGWRKQKAVGVSFSVPLKRT